MFDLSQAQVYVKAIDLKGTPRGIVAMGAEADAGAVFDQAKKQAQVVGSTLLSFADGVDIKVREAISDSALLAQLVANKRASSNADPLKWFSEYSTVLQNVGWTLQAHGWTDYSAQGVAVEVHDKIIEVLAAALGPAPAAIAIVTATINALKGMKADSPWITIFSREAVQARIARFQIGLVETDPGGVFVSLLACLVEAENTITQVLFFKFKAAKASFKATSDKVSINRNALIDLGPTIRNKVRVYQTDYLSSVLDLEI